MGQFLTMFNKTKMVFLVRTDLRMGKGKVASQVAHASILLYKAALNNRSPFLDCWLKWGQPKIVLKTDSELELTETFNEATKLKLNVCKVFDSGKTQITSGSLTVVGIGPDKSDDIDKITKKFKLL